MSIQNFSDDILKKYEIHEWKHASAILKNDFPDEWNDLIDLLKVLKLKKSWILEPGGRKSKLAIWIDEFMSKRGWIEKQFLTSVIVDEKS